jgi:2'-5' RNA ligase
VRLSIEQHIERLREAMSDYRATWSRVENMHLTLKFFGQVVVPRIESINEAAARVVKKFEPFDLLVKGSGAFPGMRQPRVLWIGIEDQSGQLAELQQLLDAECAREGFSKEQRAFRPHLTLARTRHPNGARQAAELHLTVNFAPIAFKVAELVVFRSQLSSQGSRYTALSRHFLASTLSQPAN